MDAGHGLISRTKSGLWIFSCVEEPYPDDNNRDENDRSRNPYRDHCDAARPSTLCAYVTEIPGVPCDADGADWEWGVRGEYTVRGVGCLHESIHILFFYWTRPDPSKAAP